MQVHRPLGCSNVYIELVTRTPRRRSLNCRKPSLPLTEKRGPNWHASCPAFDRVSCVSRRNSARNSMHENATLSPCLEVRRSPVLRTGEQLKHVQTLLRSDPVGGRMEPPGVAYKEVPHFPTFPSKPLLQSLRIQGISLLPLKVDSRLTPQSTQSTTKTIMYGPATLFSFGPLTVFL